MLEELAMGEEDARTGSQSLVLLQRSRCCDSQARDGRVEPVLPAARFGPDDGRPPTDCFLLLILAYMLASTKSAKPKMAVSKGNNLGLARCTLI